MARTLALRVEEENVGVEVREGEERGGGDVEGLGGDAREGGSRGDGVEDEFACRGAREAGCDDVGGGEPDDADGADRVVRGS